MKYLGLSLYALGILTIGAVLGHVLHGPDWARAVVVLGAFVSCVGGFLYGLWQRAPA